MKQLRFIMADKVIRGTHNLETWIPAKQDSPQDLRCQQCNIVYPTAGSISTLVLYEGPNKHICNDCGERYIEEFGVEDLKLNKGVKFIQ